jgi:hypothetical protein
MSILDDAKPFLQEKMATPLVFGISASGEEVGHDSRDCVAKTISTAKTNIVKYYVRRCYRGIHAGLFFNPQSHDKSELCREEGHLGKRRFEFSEVTKQSFDAYVSFLKSGNTSFLRLAQRV